MKIKEAIKQLQKLDPEAILVTSDAQYITEMINFEEFEIAGDKLVEVYSGPGSQQWIGNIADHTGKLISKGYKTPPIP